MSIESAIQHAVNGETTEFRDEVHVALMDKIKDAVALKRVEVATGLFNDQEVTHVEDIPSTDD
jgi:hypothetical protein|tara:strand:- start:229 stop:417 length:189 start_codon:yes stop_codon:yes gene_type:complete